MHLLTIFKFGHSWNGKFENDICIKNVEIFSPNEKVYKVWDKNQQIHKYYTLFSMSEIYKFMLL